MAQQPLLSELCSVCHKSAFKYRCPGCSTRTCSLPCYKLHQQRAVCDGKRDPTRFVKRARLETAAGIDHDFNFLTSIERRLGGAAEKTESTKLRAKPQKWHKGGMSLRLEQMRVIIDKAPVGLSRSRMNKTQWGGRNNKIILWTVEWITEDASRKLTTNVKDDMPLHAVYEQCVIAQPRAKRDGGRFGPAAKKRKLNGSVPRQDEDQSTPDELTVEIELPPEPEGIVQDLDEEAMDETKATSFHESEAEQPPLPDGNPQTADATSANTEPSIEAKENGDESGEQPGDEKVAIPAHQPAAEQTVAPDDQMAARFFYLLKPHTPSHQPQVLIALDSSKPLFDLLQDKVILEFPTIIVLSQPADNLPPEYVSEIAYLRKVKREPLPEILAKVYGHVDHEDGETKDEAADAAAFEEPKILEAMKRDSARPKHDGPR